MSIEDMTPRDAYDEGYRNGESSLLADVNTLCDQLDIEVGDQHEFEAIRAYVAEAKRLLDESMSYVRTFGASGSAPIITDRDALDMASDDLLNRYRDWLGSDAA